MGNNRVFHEYIYDQLQIEPGVVVLHDYSLQAFIYDITEARGQRERYLEEVAYSEGLEARADVERTLSEEESLLEHLYAYPLNRRIVEASRGIIVHSRWVQLQLKGRGVEVPIAVIPLGVRLLVPKKGQKAKFRSSLGIAPEELVVGCFGRMTPPKRIEVIVRAFSRFHALYPRSRLILVGEPDGEIASYLKQAGQRYGLQNCMQVAGYVSAALFDQYLQASDICINLRYPSAGETSATLCQALGAGLPVLASNLPQFAEFPDSCVWKVDIGLYEEDQIVAYLLELAHHPNLRRQMAQNAYEYATRITWSKVAAQYADFLKKIANLRQ
jgi:glycosyltransferase involved in cell wall biosynthesis